MRFIQQQHKQEFGNLIELKEGGQLIYTICGKRNVTEDEQSVRRVFFCVCERHKERVCLSPASSRGFIRSLVLIGISAFCQTSLEEPGKGVKHVHCLLQHYRTFELSG